MEKKFSDGEKFFVQKWIYFFRPPRRFEVVQFHDPGYPKRLIMKRVIGLPGETVIIKSNHLVIREPNGQEIILEENYLAPAVLTKVLPGQKAEIFVPAGHFFVMGDNRLMSTDSRAFGPLAGNNILGKITRL